MPLSPTVEIACDPGALSARRSGRPDDRLFPVAAWPASGFADACALVKSAEIAASCARILGAAVYAFVATATDDAFAHQRSRLSCRTPGALLDLERDHLLRTIQENAWRASILAGMLQQAGIDVVCPVRRRLDNALQALGDQPDA